MSVEAGFMKGDHSNLPKLTEEMIHDFYLENLDYLSAEIRNKKNMRATREGYGDEVIGYVQVKHGNVCVVKARITPEHKVRNKNYAVIIEVDNLQHKILKCECLDCAAAASGCKHAIAFLYWLHRRSEEPSVTSTECYWKKPTLSKVGTTIKFVTCDNFIASHSESSEDEYDTGIGSVLEKVVEEGNKHRAQSSLLEFFKETPFQNLSLYHLSISYKEGRSDIDFQEYCALKMTQTAIKLALDATSDQSKSSIWYELRYARITASKLYEAAKCKTYDGALREAIFGAAPLPDTMAMKRGRELEAKVLKIVEMKYKIKIKKVGLQLDPIHPFFGASPDGVTNEFGIEVKCPISEKTFQNYLKSGVVTPKYNAQIQLQMTLLKKKVGLFCVASPNFENNQEVTIVQVNLDTTLVEDLMSQVLIFGKRLYILFY